MSQIRGSGHSPFSTAIAYNSTKDIFFSTKSRTIDDYLDISATINSDKSLPSFRTLIHWVNYNTAEDNIILSADFDELSIMDFPRPTGSMLLL